MKTKKTDILKAIAFMVTVFFFSFFYACDPIITPGGGGPDDPDNPVAVDTMKPIIILDGIEKVTESQAEIFAWVKPYKNTKLFLEHRKVGETNYQKKAISGDYNGKDSIKVTASLFDLNVKTEYQLRIIATNKAGSDTSTILKISTYIVKDYDGNDYHVIKIGNQYWFQENLKTTHFADGTEIPNFISYPDWVSANSLAFCWVDSDSLNKKGGALYNGYFAASSKTIIEGFRVPTKSDFEELLGHIGEDVMKLLDNNTYDYTYNWWVRKSVPNQNSTGLSLKPFFMRNMGEYRKQDRTALWTKTISGNDQYGFEAYAIKEPNPSRTKEVFVGKAEVFNVGYRNVGLCIRLVK